MIMLLVLRCLDVPRVAAGADGANATSEATLGEASPVRLQALIFQAPCQTRRRNCDIPNDLPFPICSMYGIFTNICLKNHPNVGKYTIHGAYGHL